MSAPFALMIASGDEHFREMVRENLLNIPNSKVVAEYQEVAANLYIRVLQDLERNPTENRLYARGWGDTWCVLARKSEWKEDLRTIERRFFQCGGIVRACPRKQWRIRYPLREGPKSLS